MPHIAPEPGRVVHFHPQQGDPIHGSDQPLAATVAYVHNDRLINIGLLDQRGVHHSRTRVILVQPGDELPKGDYGLVASYCSWMPYQVGQAKKHEAIEGALAQGVPVNGATSVGSPIVATGEHDGAEGQSAEDAELAALIAAEEAEKAAKPKGKKS